MFVCGGCLSPWPSHPSCLICVYPLSEQAELTPETQASWEKGLRRAIFSLGHSGLSEESGRLGGVAEGGEGEHREQHSRQEVKVREDRWEQL